MRYIGILLLLFFFTCTSAQTLTVDELGNDMVKKTSWETLNKSNPKEPATVYYRLTYFNNSYYLDVKMLIYAGIRLQSFYIDRDEEFIIKLDNGEIITLYCYTRTESCQGCGSTGLLGSSGEGIYVIYPIDESDLEMLKEHKIVKLRIFTSEGYADCDIKGKDSAKFKRAVNLIKID